MRLNTIGDTLTGSSHRVEPDKRMPSGSYNLFFTTSIDYVLCTKEGIPLLGIDFDGLGGGLQQLGGIHAR